MFWFRDLISDFAKMGRFRPMFETSKNFKPVESEHVIYYFKALDLEISKIEFKKDLEISKMELIPQNI